MSIKKVLKDISSVVILFFISSPLVFAETVEENGSAGAAGSQRGHQWGWAPPKGGKQKEEFVDNQQPGQGGFMPGGPGFAARGHFYGVPHPFAPQQYPQGFQAQPGPKGGFMFNEMNVNENGSAKNAEANNGSNRLPYSGCGCGCCRGCYNPYYY